MTKPTKPTTATWVENQRIAKQEFWDHASRVAGMTVDELRKLFDDDMPYNYAVYRSWHNTAKTKVARGETPWTILDGPFGSSTFADPEHLDKAVQVLVDERKARLHYATELEQFEAKSWSAGRC